MATIVSDEPDDKAPAYDATEPGHSSSGAIARPDASTRLDAMARRIAEHSGYGAESRRELHAELLDHLHDMLDDERARCISMEVAVERVLVRFGNPAVIARDIWRMGVAEKLRRSWRLPGVAVSLLLADIVAATIWIGTDMVSTSPSRAWYASLLVAFAAGVAVLHWSCSALVRAGTAMLQAASRDHVAWPETILGCGLAATGITGLFVLRPGAVANIIGSRMEHVPAWVSVWEWAGVVSVALMLIGVASVLCRRVDLGEDVRRV
jgi:hypothetical protein